MKKTNRVIIVELSFGGIFSFQPGEVVKFGNPLYPAKKQAKQIKPGDLVSFAGFYEDVKSVNCEIQPLTI